MPTSAQLDEYKAAQVGLVALASEALRGFWVDLDVEDANAARDALLMIMPALTDEFGASAAALAADWYDDLRETEGAARTAFAATMAPTAPTEKIEAQVRFAVSHLYGGNPDDALLNLLNVIGKDVLQPGWDTIVNSANADPDAYGWHRETRSSRSYASGCGFCQMLEGRGGVYKRSTASFASHGSCRCVAYPSWDPGAEEVSADVYMASARQSTARSRRRVYAFVGDGPVRNRF